MYKRCKISEDGIFRTTHRVKNSVFEKINFQGVLWYKKKNKIKKMHRSTPGKLFFSKTDFFTRCVVLKNPFLLIFNKFRWKLPVSFRPSIICMHILVSSSYHGLESWWRMKTLLAQYQNQSTLKTLFARVERDLWNQMFPPSAVSALAAHTTFIRHCFI